MKANGQDTTTPAIARPGFRTPKDRQRERKLRERMSLAIERLIAVLDALEAPEEELEEETDAEEPDGEPMLGATLAINQTKAWRGATLCGDCGEREFDDADREPSLGASENLGGYSSQVYWASGHSGAPVRLSDLEHESEDEPSLAFIETIDQLDLIYGGDSEMEADYADDEPSLGSLEFAGDARYNVHQGAWAASSSDDREDDPAEKGEPEEGI